MRFSNTLRKIGAGFILGAFSVTTFAQSKAFDVTRMDPSALACNDFFQYANGTWVKNTEIPADRSRFGSFDILSENNRNILREVAETTAKNTGAAKGSDEQLVGDFYASCMNEASIERAGTKPLNPYLKEINRIKDARNMATVIAKMHTDSVPAIFGFGAGPDIKNSTTNIANAGQGGLSLPNREYYTKDDAKSQEIRTKFVQHMTNMFALLGEDGAQAKIDADTVMRIQTRLALASKAPVELRNPEARYNKISFADAQKLTPNFDWNAYLRQRGAPTFTEINIGQPDFFKEVNAMLADVPMNDWKTYLRWMVLNDAANVLPKKFADENFDFYSRTLRGTKEQEPRWKRCTAMVDRTVGEALGQAYVKRAFTPEAKKRMDDLINNLFAAYRERLAQLDWMSPETRQKALEKLNTYQRKIGYPDKLRGYAGLKVDRKSYFDNTIRSAKFETNRNLQDLGKPVDKTRWGMTPPTVNAYYSPISNEIVFPAGILQPPFFNANADDAINYGAIGAVIGHEITHGFDDQGSKFDASGNFKSWWTESDRKQFEAKADCVSNQFSAYEVLPGLNMQGKLTLGENIADLGGLTMAYRAYQKSLEGKPRPANIDGFTPEQRFFLGYAQVWAGKSRDEAVRQQVQTDPHAIGSFRVNGPLSNLPVFAEAFQCKTGDKMVRDDRCQIW
ncbi:MAG: M13 family metallopeptidase [Pyrinomonadaceae bacterium]